MVSGVDRRALRGLARCAVGVGGGGIVEWGAGVGVVRGAVGGGGGGRARGYPKHNSYLNKQTLHRCRLATGADQLYAGAPAHDPTHPQSPFRRRLRRPRLDHLPPFPSPSPVNCVINNSIFKVFTLD